LVRVDVAPEQRAGGNRHAIEVHATTTDRIGLARRRALTAGAKENPIPLDDPA
jgi:hypothetical protein